MTIVYTIGKGSEKDMENLILTQLSKSYRVTYIKSKSLVQCGQGYEIIVADFPEIKSLYVDECIIVMKSGGIVPNIPLPEKSIIVVNSENIEQLTALKTDSKKRVITCGASEKDTLSYSSLTSDSIVISLNREITAFSGRVIQPLEIPLKLEKFPKDVYYPIAFTALRLLLDDFNSELGNLI
ncbi:MAG: hypothetical protein FWD34_01400 [Oscillospiraceae bacterium]|nr:hypothetical protein [Oscillospiraceae bacterium]